MPLCLLLACGIPKLQVLYEGTPIQEGDDIALETLRQFDPFPVLDFQLKNLGEAELILTEADISPTLSHDLILPLHLPPGETIHLRTKYHTESIERYHHHIMVANQDIAFPFHIMGEITPYIQYHPQELPAVDRAIEAEFERQGPVGLSVGIVEGKNIIYLKGFGYADQETKTRVDPKRHRFRWASLSKGLVGLMTLHSVEKGLLDLDAPIQELFPSFSQPSTYLPKGCKRPSCAQPLPEDSKAITMRMLLSHTAGIQHYENGVVNPVPPDENVNNPDINTGMSWALSFWQDAPLVSLPGEEHNYSTFGYNLAGVVLEEVIGQSLEQQVSETLNHIASAPSIQPDYHWNPANNRVVGYYQNKGTTRISGDDDVSWKLAGGGFTSTPADLARYCAVLINEQLLSAATKKNLLWAPQENAPIYGLGFYIKDRTISHTGAQQGTRTALLIDEDNNRCYIAMSNSTWTSPFNFLTAAKAQLP